MSTIPSISEESLLTYNYIKRQPQKKGKVSFFVLNRGGKFNRRELFAQLISLNLGDVNFVESPNFTFDSQEISKDFPKLNFLMIQKKITWGEIINLIVQESLSDYVFILWSDMQLHSPSHFSTNLKAALELEHLYQVPHLFTQENEDVPSIQVPVMMKKKLLVMPLSQPKPQSLSIFPYDFCGLIHKPSFTAMTGYDGMIKTPFWQKMDFGFRAFLWGYQIVYNEALKCGYAMEQIPENTTPDKGYKYFYLKNIFVKVKNQAASLDTWAFFRYLFKSDNGPYYSYKEFKMIQNWVRENHRKFMTDARNLIDKWVIME
ncbi:MAG: hypothetical protein JXR70_07550 [Spirochaetales bacterium]|nr:hypothetical protein [Spirochaetales bacterium]